MFEDWIERVAGKMSPIVPQVLIASFGLAFLRIWRVWVFSVIKSIPVGDVLHLTLRDVYSLGIVLSMAACLVILYRRHSLTRGPVVIAGLAVATLGTAGLLVVRNTGTTDMLAATIPLTLCIAFGFAVIQSAWIEWLGMHAIPVTVLLSCTIAWVVHAALWAGLGALDPTEPFLHVAMLLMPLLSVTAMLADATRLRQTPSQTEGCSQAALDGQAVSVDLGSCGADAIRQALPIMVWTWVFAVAYTLGMSYTGLGTSVLGEILPVVILAAGFIALGSNFDYTTIYRFAFIILALGFIAAALNSQDLAFVQSCFSASNSIITALATTFVCAAAALRHISAAWTYSALMLGWHVMPLVVRRLISLTGFDAGAAGMLFAIIATAALLVFALAVWKGSDLLSQWRTACEVDERDLFLERCQALAVRGKLGERETGVLVLLAQGKSYTQISEQLFIAMGTVRAHAGHIYDKLGVHSRQELVELIESEDCETGSQEQ